MTFFGFLAGLLTTGCWLPQLLRSWRTRSTSDISWLYLMVLTLGVAMWAVYGVFRSDPVIFITNVVTVLFMTFLMTLKLTERRRAVAPSTE